MGVELHDLGSPAQLGAFVVLLGILIRQLVPWRQLTLTAEQQIRKELNDRITDLKHNYEEVTKRLIACEKECNDQRIQLEREMIALQRKHISEQIAVVQTIVELFPDAPQLKMLLNALETGRRSVQYLGEVEGDKKDGQ